MKKAVKILVYIVVVTLPPIVSPDDVGFLWQCPKCLEKGVFSPIEMWCPRCMCDQECLFYGDCCVDIKINNGLHTQEIQSDFTCITTPNDSKFRFKDLSHGDGFYMVTNYRRHDGFIENCDSTVLPVSCPQTGKTYINNQCAFLNKETSCSNWKIRGKCKYNRKRVAVCEDYIVPPKFAELRYCDIRRSEPIIAQCDPEFQASYQEYSDSCVKYFVLFQNPENNKVYRNIYCALCNGFVIRLPSGPILPIEYPVKTLVGFTDQFDKSVKSCDGRISWMDIGANKCRPIQCYSNKVLRGEECEYDNMTALGNTYQMMINLKIPTRARVPFFKQMIGNMMTSISLLIYSTDYTVTTSKPVLIGGSSYIYMNVWFIVNSNITLEDFETVISRSGAGYFEASALSLDSKINYTYVSHSQPIMRHFVSNITTKLCCSEKPVSEVGEVIAAKYNYEPISHQISCSFIEFYNKAFDADNALASVEHLNLTLSDDEFSVFHDDLRVCFQTFLNKKNFTHSNETIEYYDTHTKFDWILWYLTIVLITLSLISICIALITYGMFPEMRTQPGINNIGLMLNLFLAQLTVITGLDQTQDKILCRSIGISIHYLWLGMALWMNVCTFHMFKVFVLQKLVRNSAPSHGIQTLKYIAYANGLPMILIVCIIITNVTLSGGMDIGYGGNVCYLSSKQLVGYCFVLPLCLVIILNIVFFLWTIISISRVKQQGKQSGERNNIIIYIKLSVLTGLFWLLAILSNFVTSWALEYLSVILNASQGVFILWSFILNKSVLSKWKRRLFSETESGSIEQATTSSQLKSV
ncbi:uncharacterized protein LOC126827114 [Patella vulgata]|uniref:uncharacterized protein LOC126827114 n=1 Tax=Patella vulgata TaxID=6465 RepID=UPI0021804154|nr:uncharacterized protein LOC126827114 [Patella vulgata]